VGVGGDAKRLVIQVLSHRHSAKWTSCPSEVELLESEFSIRMFSYLNESRHYHQWGAVVVVCVSANQLQNALPQSSVDVPRTCKKLLRNPLTHLA
jgi:hypothetical protein